MMFEATNRLRDRGWTYTIQVSFVEIYNEVLRDLLSLGKSDQKKLEIKHVEQADGSKIAQVGHARIHGHVCTHKHIPSLLACISL
jgi:kinesin family protein C1